MEKQIFSEQISRFDFQLKPIAQTMYTNFHLSLAKTTDQKETQNLKIRPVEDSR